MNGLSQIKSINAWSKSEDAKAFEQKRAAQSKRIASKNTAEKFLMLQGRKVEIS